MEIKDQRKFIQELWARYEDQLVQHPSRDGLAPPPFVGMMSAVEDLIRQRIVEAFERIGAHHWHQGHKKKLRAEIEVLKAEEAERLKAAKRSTKVYDLKPRD